MLPPFFVQGFPLAEKLRDLRARASQTYRKQLTPAGTQINTLEAKVAADTTLEKILSTSYWFSQVAILRPLDRIEVNWEDGSRIVLLRCMGIDEKAGSVLMAVISDTPFDAPDLPKGYSYSYVSEGTGWRIMRTDEGTGKEFPLRQGFATKMEAHVWFTGEVNDGAAAKAEADKAHKPAATPPAKGGKPETAKKEPEHA